MTQNMIKLQNGIQHLFDDNIVIFENLSRSTKYAINDDYNRSTVILQSTSSLR